MNQKVILPQQARNFENKLSPKNSCSFGKDNKNRDVLIPPEAKIEAVRPGEVFNETESTRAKGLKRLKERVEAVKQKHGPTHSRLVKPLIDLYLWYKSFGHLREAEDVYAEAARIVRKNTKADIKKRELGFFIKTLARVRLLFMQDKTLLAPSIGKILEQKGWKKGSTNYLTP